MTFSHETLQSTLQTLTTETAMRMLALAGSTHEFENLLIGLARNFSVEIPAHVHTTIAQASKRWHAAARNRQINYKAC